MNNLFYSELSRNPSRNEGTDDDVDESKNHFDDVIGVTSDVTETSSDNSSKKEFRLVRLRCSIEGEDDSAKSLGIFIARVRENQNNGENVAAYYIAHIMHDGLVWR